MKSKTNELLEVRKNFKVCPTCGGSGVTSKKPFETSLCDSCTKCQCDGPNCQCLRNTCFKCQGTGIVINS